MNITGFFGGLLVLFVVVGVLAMAVQSPVSTVQALSAGADTITGLTHGLEGKP
jgi:hypothetical protein